MARGGTELLKTAGICTGLLAAVAMAASLLSVKAAPQPALQSSQDSVAQARLAAGKPFAPACKASDIVDPRPDPRWVAASFAGDKCQAPPMPAAIDGYTAKRIQIVAGMAQAKRYEASADAFQRCIRDFVTDQRSVADRANKPLNLPLVMIENHRLLASDKDKKLVESRMGAAINAFNEYGSECPG
jgi:hypothetical protein